MISYSIISCSTKVTVGKQTPQNEFIHGETRLHQTTSDFSNAEGKKWFIYVYLIACFVPLGACTSTTYVSAVPFEPTLVADFIFPVDLHAIKQVQFPHNPHRFKYPCMFPAQIRFVWKEGFPEIWWLRTLLSRFSPFIAWKVAMNCDGENDQDFNATKTRWLSTASLEARTWWCNENGLR